MPLKPLNHHYAMENPASVYDEEAMTALELAGRTTAKVNETVRAFNNLENTTTETLAGIPTMVKEDVQKHIDNGEFDKSIDEYAGGLENRLDNLLGSVQVGTTTMDAEVIDARTNGTGITYLNLGNAIRGQVKDANMAQITKVHNAHFEIDTTAKTIALVLDNSWCALFGHKRVFTDAVACSTVYTYQNKAGSYLFTYDTGEKTIKQYDMNTTAKADVPVNELIICGLYIQSTGKIASVFDCAITSQVYVDGVEATEMTDANFAQVTRMYGVKFNIDTNNKTVSLDPFTDLPVLFGHKQLKVLSGGCFSGYTYNTESGGSYLFTYDKGNNRIKQYDMNTTTKADVPLSDLIICGVYFSRTGAVGTIFDCAVLDSVTINDIDYGTADHNNRTCNIFKKVVCCGDSFTAGWMKAPNGNVADKTEYAWPAFASKLTGNNWVNCGISGATAIDWLSRGGSDFIESAGKSQAYVIGLAINDNYTNVPIGTVNDRDTNPNTFIGGLSAIIAAIRAKSTVDAHIFVCTCPQAVGNMGLYNQAIRDLCETYTYHVHCLDLEANAHLFKADSFIKSAKNNHYTAVGYEQMGEAMTHAISTFINNNPALFETVPYIAYE